MSKKIVFAIDTNTAGGGERVIATLANYMSEKGHETYLINSDSDSSFYPINEKVNVLKMNLDRSRAGRVGRFIKKYSYLKSFFWQKKPDAVVAFLFNMEAPTILAGLATHTRVFTSVRNTVHAYPRHERVFRKRFYPRIAGVIFQSKQVQTHDDFKKLKNSAMIMNPMAGEITDKVCPIPYEQRRNIIISVARLEKQKNHEMTIKAFSQIHPDFPDCELHIFGEGSLRAKLQRMIHELELEDKIILEGAMPGATWKNRDAKLFVMSSDYEGFPNALAEAMVFGIPSISTNFDTGVASELIQEGINGWLVEVGDVEGLASKMRNALLMGEDIDDISKRCTDLYYMINSNTICRQWEEFIFHE